MLGFKGSSGGSGTDINAAIDLAIDNVMNQKLEQESGINIAWLFKDEGAQESKFSNFVNKLKNVFTSVKVAYQRSVFSSMFDTDSFISMLLTLPAMFTGGLGLGSLSLMSDAATDIVDFVQSKHVQQRYTEGYMQGTLASLHYAMKKAPARSQIDKSSMPHHIEQNSLTVQNKPYLKEPMILQSSAFSGIAPQLVIEQTDALIARTDQLLADIKSQYEIEIEKIKQKLVVLQEMVNSESDFKEILIQKFRKKGEGTIMIFLEGLSLYPVFEPGSLIPVKIMRTDAEYEVGDIVLFQRSGVFIVHEIYYKYTDKDGTVKYKTRGLNHETNPRVDRGVLSGDQIYGIADLSEEFLASIPALESQGLAFHTKAYAKPNNPIYVKTSELFSAVENAINTFYETSDSINDIMGHFSDIVSKKSSLTSASIDKIDKVLDHDLLNAFIYVLSDFIINEDSAINREFYDNTIKMVREYAKSFNIILKQKNPYHPLFNNEQVRGALILDHLYKYAGFDLLFGRQFSNDIFETGKKSISYILHHFRLSIESYIRKQSVDTNDILMTQSDNHRTYDTDLTEAQAEALIEAWDNLMELGEKNGEITQDDIKNAFKNVLVGKNKVEVVYDKYKWNFREMVNIINDFLNDKLDNELDNYFTKKWGNFYNRWRYKYCDITIDEQINKANELVSNYERENK